MRTHTHWLSYCEGSPKCIRIHLDLVPGPRLFLTGSPLVGERLQERERDLRRTRSSQVPFLLISRAGEGLLECPYGIVAALRSFTVTETKVGMGTRKRKMATETQTTASQRKFFTSPNIFWTLFLLGGLALLYVS